MSAFEQVWVLSSIIDAHCNTCDLQKVEAPDKAWQYLIVAAEPYETIAFKVPSKEIDKHPDKLWTVWNKVRLH